MLEGLSIHMEHGLDLAPSNVRMPLAIARVK
jgi:hypothetical protein